MDSNKNDEIKKPDYYKSSTKILVDTTVGFIIAVVLGVISVSLFSRFNNSFTLAFVVIVQICLLIGGGILYKNGQRKYLGLGLIAPTCMAATVGILAMLVFGACSMLFGF